MVASFPTRDASSLFFFQESILLPLTQAMTQRKYYSTTTMTEAKL